MNHVLKSITPMTCEEHELSTGMSSIIYMKNGLSVDSHGNAEHHEAIVLACNVHNELLEALEDCADDLEAEINAREGSVLPRKIERDMISVKKARDAIAKAKGDNS